MDTHAKIIYGPSRRTKLVAIEPAGEKTLLAQDLGNLDAREVNRLETGHAVDELPLHSSRMLEPRLVDEPA